jgi:predicted RNase H-like HicB family nuclease
MDIEYTVQIWKEDDQFIAHAMPLDVMSSGNTADEARAAVNEAVQLFLLTAKEAGTLEEILQEAGLRGTSYTCRWRRIIGARRPISRPHHGCRCPPR